MLQINDMNTHTCFKKGEVIYREGDVLNYLYIIHTGSVKIYHLFDSGKEQLLHVLTAGEFMGELALFAMKQVDRNAVALEDSQICMIHRDDMQF